MTSGQQSSREISTRGKLLVQRTLTGLGVRVHEAMRGSGYHCSAYRDGASEPKSVWVTTNLKPKPAGGGGPPALAWFIGQNVKADIVALADLSSGRVWLLEYSEIAATAQQHSRSGHKIVMVTQAGWTSAPHDRIRDDEFTHLLAERRVVDLFG